MPEWPPDWPPWEWVTGDPVQCGRASYFFGVLAGVAAVFVVLFPLQLLGIISLRWPPVPMVYWLPLLWAELAVVFALPILIRRRFALVAALGISPLGLRLKLPFPFGSRLASLEYVSWTQVRRVGPEWVDLIGFRGGGLLPERYRLTAAQSQRLAAFLGWAPTRA